MKDSGASSRFHKDSGASFTSHTENTQDCWVETKTFCYSAATQIPEQALAPCTGRRGRAPAIAQCHGKRDALARISTSKVYKSVSIRFSRAVKLYVILLCGAKKIDEVWLKVNEVFTRRLLRIEQSHVLQFASSPEVDVDVAGNIPHLIIFSYQYAPYL